MLDYNCRITEWQRWICQFEQFCLASGLSAESNERQVSTLLYCLGQDADEILVSTGITTEERKTYSEVLRKFEQFFKVRKNTILRARFNRQNQQEGESAEQYIMVLFGLAESCDYGEFKDQMIRDRLVVGIKDSGLSERLQMDPKLTVEKAMKMIQQKEAVHEQRIALDSVRAKKQQSNKFIKPSFNNTCGRCGKGTINLLLEKQCAIDVKRKATNNYNVALIWEQVSTVFPQRLVLTHHF